MELEGKIIIDLPLQSGTSKAGNPWKKKEWVLETFGSYPRKVKFHVFGDRADSMLFEVGKCYSVSIDIESREFNGRWYTDVSAFNMREIADPTMGGGYPPMGAPMGAPAGQYPQAAPYQAPAPGVGAPGMGAPAAPGFTSAPNDAEDLPF